MRFRGIASAILILAMLVAPASAARLFTLPGGALNDGTMQFQIGDQKYPGSWLKLATDPELAAAGITYQTVADPTPTTLVGILMLGDSITFYGDWPTVLGYTPVINGGVRSETTSEILVRVPALLLNRPRACFIEGGVNDISLNFTQAQTIANIKAIISLCLAAGATPYVQAILPVSAAYVGPAQVNNTNITALNAAIKAAISTIPGGQWINWGGALGAADYVDGIHLTASGFTKWNAAIATYVNLYR